MSDAAFALKIDVDTLAGLRDGVLRLLELLARRGVRATFFVAMGPDRTGRAALRALRQRGFLAKMVRSRAPRLYPLETMLRGTLLPAVEIASALPGRLREIRAAGHELGVHGWDHVLWHDRLSVMDEEAVRAEVRRAAWRFEQILGERPRAFAAPGWQCTAASLRAVDEAGFAYRSDTRGWAPYRPLAGGYRGRAPELPTTLPTLDEMIGLAGRGVVELVRVYAGWVRPGALHVHTAHAEVEGGPWAAHLDGLLERVADALPVRTLGEVAAALPSALAEAPVVSETLPGRGGTVACQRA